MFSALDMVQPRRSSKANAFLVANHLAQLFDHNRLNIKFFDYCGNFFTWVVTENMITEMLMTEKNSLNCPK